MFIMSARGRNMLSRVIVHSDLNHCYAQNEEMLNPELRDVPMVVGGHEELRHGIILAKNDKAKVYGIKTAETLRDALKKCPELVVVPPHYEDYKYYTERVKNIYREYTDQVESYGLDEAWIDLTHSQRLFGDGVELARVIQKRIAEELGLTVSMGVSYNKIFAKLGSDLDKKQGFVVIDENNYQEKIFDLPVEDLFYVGPATAYKLHRIGLHTIGALANAHYYDIVERFGKHGALIWCFANGLEEGEVHLSDYQAEPKSIGNGVTAVHDLRSYEETKLVFRVLSESIASRLKDANMKAYVISIGLRDNKLAWFTRQRKIFEATNIADEILAVAMSLLKENYNFKMPLRSVSISASKLINDSQVVQLSLLNDEEKRQNNKQLDLTIDKIRDKFGFEKVKRLSMLLDNDLTNFNPKADHTIHPEGYI